MIGNYSLGERGINISAEMCKDFDECYTRFIAKSFLHIIPKCKNRG